MSLYAFGDITGSVCRATSINYGGSGWTVTDGWFPVNQQMLHMETYFIDQLHGVNKIIAVGMGDKIAYNKPYYYNESFPIIQDWTVGTINNGIQPRPTAPSDLTATATSYDEIQLTWNSNSEHQANFSIQRSTNGVTFSFLTTVGIDTTVYNNTGLDATQTYWYKVKASNAIGDSSYSNVAYATTLTPPPHADFIWSINPSNGKQIDFTSTATGYLYQDWDFGDGSPHDTTSTNPSHIYADYMTSYPVIYEVSNDTTSDSTTITVTTDYDYFYFTRPAFSSDTTDAITDAVHIKRNDYGGGIYNCITETYYTKYYSPEDTEWSNPQEGIISDPTSLSYDKWHVNFSPGNVVEKYIYMHIISEDRYFELFFFSWGSGGTGEFSYKRREVIIS